MEMMLSILLELKFFGIKVINQEDFYELAARFLFNFFVCFYVVRYIYYPMTRNKDYLFTYIMFSVVVFFLCIVLANVKLQIGFALGLFALFGMMRYRTDAIRIKEMTYLFIIIGLSVINALASKKVSYAEVVFTNLAVVACTYAFEKIWFLKLERQKTIVYENVDLVKPENYDRLIEDLNKRTGLDIHKVEVGKIDYMRDIAILRIYYYDDQGEVSSYQQDNDEQLS
jgi:hypothetical protein